MSGLCRVNAAWIQDFARAERHGRRYDWPRMKPELSEKMLAASAGWPVVHSARKIRDGGKVSRVSYEHPVLKGAVRSGSRTYGSGLRLGETIENLCGCYESWSEGTICAHSVAVALVAMEGKLAAADSGQASPS